MWVNVGKNSKKVSALLALPLLNKLEFDQLNREIFTTISSDVTVIIAIRLYVVFRKILLLLFA